MGLLKVGTPKSWEDSKKDLRYIRKAGVRQFISTYNRVKDLQGDELLWGDEIEYGIFHLDPENKKTRIALRGKEVMDELNRKETLNGNKGEGCHFVPEYGAWMVEATPKRPYNGYTSDLLRVERSMRLRRKRMLTALGENEVAPTMSTFPMLGALGDDGSVPPVKVGGDVTLSDYIGDGIINPHPRFATLSANIRQRRGEKVNIRVPLFRDSNTPEYAHYRSSKGIVDGCCGSDSFQLWGYGKGDASHEEHGNDFVEVGCSKNSLDENIQATLSKWKVDVQCKGCLGLFYRRAPNVIVPDADWPRNGDIVVGYEIHDVPGWIRLQNGYYLPIHSEDNKVSFLRKVSKTENPSNGEMRRIGSGTPLFHTAENQLDEDCASLCKEGGGVAAEDDDDTESSEEQRENISAAIHMDAMAFGMGCCCLQITFQAKDMDESRFIYDQLAVMAPIMMALTASTPLLKGRIADTDARWGVISESVDDRTPAERGRQDLKSPHEELVEKGKRRLHKSRYDCISTYIYQGTVMGQGDPGTNEGLENRVLNTYNDIPVPIDRSTYEMLREAGIDPALSQHVAHLFIRDPLVIFNGAVEEVDDDIQTEHWESIQSTNWQSVRWKPPPPRNSPNDPHIGWRTEFRSMEIQLTDFENAAFTAFTVLLTRVIIAFDLNLYIPLSRVDSNMQRAHSRNAAAKGKFFFRRHLAPLEEGDDGFGAKYSSMFSRANMERASSHDSEESSDRGGSTAGISKQRRTAPFAPGSNENNSYEEMAMSEIMCGKGDYFPGLIPLVHAYLDYINCDTITRGRLNTYLDFIEKRSTGELVTTATWMRNYVRSHPAYKGDSVVTDEIAYDLVRMCTDIGLGNVHVPELLGDIKIAPVTAEGAYEIRLDSKRAQNERVLQLLQRYKTRSSNSVKK